MELDNASRARAGSEAPTAEPKSGREGLWGSSRTRRDVRYLLRLPASPSKPDPARLGPCPERAAPTASARQHADPSLVGIKLGRTESSVRS